MKQNNVSIDNHSNSLGRTFWRAESLSINYLWIKSRKHFNTKLKQPASVWRQRSTWIVMAEKLNSECRSFVALVSTVCASASSSEQTEHAVRHRLSLSRMYAVMRVGPPAVTWTDSSDCVMLRLQMCKLWTSVTPPTDSSCFLTTSTPTPRGAPAWRTFSLRHSGKVWRACWQSLLTLHQYPENILGDREGRPQNQGREQEGANWICYFIFRLWVTQASKRKRISSVNLCFVPSNLCADGPLAFLNMDMKVPLTPTQRWMMAAANSTPTLCTRSPTTWMNAALTLALPWLQWPCCGGSWSGLWLLPWETPDWWRISTILHRSTSKVSEESPLWRIPTTGSSYSQNIDSNSTSRGDEHDLSVNVVVSMDESLEGRQD